MFAAWLAAAQAEYEQAKYGHIPESALLEAGSILSETYGKVLDAYRELDPDAPETQQTRQLRLDAAFVRDELERLGLA